MVWNVDMHAKCIEIHSRQIASLAMIHVNIDVVLSRLRVHPSVATLFQRQQQSRSPCTQSMILLIESRIITGYVNPDRVWI